MILHSFVLAFECKLAVAEARSLFCSSTPMYFLFFIFVYDFVSPSLHYPIDVMTVVSVFGCPLPSFVVSEVMSSRLAAISGLRHSQSFPLPLIWDVHC